MVINNLNVNNDDTHCTITISRHVDYFHYVYINIYVLLVFHKSDKSREIVLFYCKNRLRCSIFYYHFLATFIFLQK